VAKFRSAAVPLIIAFNRCVPQPIALRGTLIDISSAGGYGSSMTKALLAAALYYAPLS
jgi:hypothetical protein